MSKVDVMERYRALERDECPDCAAPVTEPHRIHCPRGLHAVTLAEAVHVEYVRAEQLQGAVGDRDALLDFVRRFRSWATTADLNRLAHEADDLLRGR